MSTNAQHTPGPWHFEAGVEDNEGEFYVCHAATVCDATTVCNPGSEADARLIAAAPELLEALIEAAEFIQPFNRAEALLDRIDAAIALATGEPK